MPSAGTDFVASDDPISTASAGGLEVEGSGGEDRWDAGKNLAKPEGRPSFVSFLPYSRAVLIATPPARS